ncbi:MAG: serine--tRNA ligase [Candidatus Blackburnbacteria bacterium RIFCSPLOWO2_02_FULL_44_9]|uniref:Serine--tRNA ligase n=1 Tax=Candidatus Blackburnbacteria bacterium RIFCSPHIGHO2_02_FULL_44_20 TaxID=1797516 RepID=A0A1G1V7M7_9BACT|nr:MAG: serine--tRNA ligase [Candidatus Blackburnbacteria bacterium RIFCSPHIGHO2_12_FULL_44_25]OGY11281.1 MAG: serine--tRNA ligase [Candidatus Blackburnbacteria bacterium RIFCSPHIGHO2_02_FULL_44_20]OGY15387.1 MAG: serine--tRNA ligase [Candidatus Blackburnbacteria bacterium RIFCSPLOWO2_02_FULL_44_9]
MIDINLIRENPELVKAGVARKHYDAGIVDRVVALDKERLDLLQKVEELRHERNEISKNDSPENREKGKEIKEKLKEIEPQLEKAEEQLNTAFQGIPNLPQDDVPEGEGEKDNKVLREWGEPKKFSFTPKDHVELGKELDIIDFEKAAKVSGSDFYYLKNDGVLLELALVNYGIRFLIERGFTPMITPDLAKERYYLGTGYLPKGDEAQIYTVQGHDLGLIATAEVTLAGYHADETLNKKDLPIKYAGYSHCFRQEAGAYGKYSKGLYRVHQFTKVEMFAYTKPEDSNNMLQEFLKTEEEFWQSLEIPYRVVEMCAGDLGSQATQKYDLEAWMPGRNDWGEVTSTSNTTDYQARNLNIKFRDGDETKYVHMLNGTLFAASRAPIAILENNQQEDGSVVIPEVLHPYMGKDKIEK